MQLSANLRCGCIQRIRQFKRRIRADNVRLQLPLMPGNEPTVSINTECAEDNTVKIVEIDPGSDVGMFPVIPKIVRATLPHTSSTSTTPGTARSAEAICGETR